MRFVAAPVVHQLVVCECEGPGTELGAGLVAGRGIYHGEPGVLSQVIGQSSVASISEKIAPQALAVAGVERLKRGGMAAAVGEHQRFVGLLLIHHRAHYAKPDAQCEPMWRKSYSSHCPGWRMPGLGA